jgi:signal transduction histidine kinase
MIVMKTILLILSFVILSRVNAQTERQAYLDSLLIQVQKTKADTTKARLFSKISDWYIDNDIDKALLYADTALHLAKINNWKGGIAAGLVNYGNIWNFKGDYGKAIDYFKMAYNINKELKSTRGMANNLYSLGSANERLSNYPAAANYYFESLRINESLPGNDLQVANCLGGIAVIYFLQHDYQKSMEYSLKVIDKQQSLHNETGLLNEYINIADTYYRLKDSVNAEKYNLMALQLSKKSGLALQEGVAYSQLGLLYGNNPALSIGYFFRAQEKLDAISSNFSSTILNRGEIGKAFLKIYKSGNEIPILTGYPDYLPKTKEALLKKAELFLQKAVSESRETGDKDKEASFSENLAEVQYLNGNFKGAYANLNISYLLHDSLYSQENKNKIAAFESQKKVDLKDKEIQINKLIIDNQRKTQLGLLAGICFLGIIGGLLYRQSNTRKKTNTTLLKLNTDLDEANKVKAKFFGILSHDLRGPVANLVNFLHLQKTSPGLFTAVQAEAHQNKISDSAESLLETMESMLFWSKEQMEYFKPQIKNIAIDDLFTYIQNFFSQTEQVAFTYKSETGLVVAADENYLRVIMQNLTSNAIRALKNTPGAMIEWNARKEWDKTILSITDNGPGISNENAKLLFEENIAINAKNGFGLHLVRDLAKAIRYKISIQSQPGMGTTFILTPIQA